MDAATLAPREFAGGILPDYDGGSLLNIPTTLARHLADRELGLAPLHDGALPRHLLEGADRVVLLLADGLGWEQLEAARRAGHAPHLDRLAREGHAAPLTTVVPSTTCTALTSLATGQPAGRHGILGYRTFLPRLGATFNMIRLQPLLGGRDLFGLGVDPAEFLGHPTLTGVLSDAGVAAEVVTRRAYRTSPLTRMSHSGVEPAGYVGAGDAFVQARRALERIGDRRGYLEIYWDEVDATGHVYGPDSDEYAGAVASLDHALGEGLLDRVDDPGTLLLVTADHGHVTIRPENVLQWNAHPDLLDLLDVPPTGEGRFNYLHVRDGQRDTVRGMIEDRLAHAAEVVTVEDALEAGAFGPGPLHHEFGGRAGDLVVVARDGYRFEYHLTSQVGPSALTGVHGGISPTEMRIPLVAARLG